MLSLPTLSRIRLWHGRQSGLGLWCLPGEPTVEAPNQIVPEETTPHRSGTVLDGVTRSHRRENAQDTKYQQRNEHRNHHDVTACSAESLIARRWLGGIRIDVDGQWTDYSESIGRFEVNPNAMAVDGGRLYAGTLDQGIQIYDDRQGHWQQVREGLPSQNVTAFAFTSDRVLVGTDGGLIEIRKDAF